MISPDLVVGADGVRRCAWAAGSADLTTYHDQEWGQPVHGDDAVFERLSLEAFQSGLSWLTILRKRPAFREAFSGFSIEAVARFTAEDEMRCLADPRIVRNRSKIAATVANARAAASLIDRDGPGALDRLVWSVRSAGRRRPARTADIPSTTSDSIHLARLLRSAGFSFVGPTTAYAAMQAIGIVDDHLRGCPAGSDRR